MTWVLGPMIRLILFSLIAAKANEERIDYENSNEIAIRQEPFAG